MSSRSPRSPTMQQGFTLVEVLVVLSLVAMIGSVLFQVLERSYRLQERFGVELFSVQQGQMAVSWYRQTVQGLHPDYPDGANIFQGGPTEFAGLSTNPLSDDYGSPTRITWKLRSGATTGVTELLYVDRQQTTPLLGWRTTEARFVYLDDQQLPHDSWPPPLGLFPQLPRQIQLRTADAGEAVVVVAGPMGPTAPPLRIRDLLGLQP